VDGSSGQIIRRRRRGRNRRRGWSVARKPLTRKPRFLLVPDIKALADCLFSQVLKLLCAACAEGAGKGKTSLADVVGRFALQSIDLARLRF